MLTDKENQLTKVKLIYQIIFRQLTAKKSQQSHTPFLDKLGYLKKAEPKQQTTQSYKTIIPVHWVTVISLCTEHPREQEQRRGRKKFPVILKFHHLLIYYYCLFLKVPPLPEKNTF